MATSSYPKSVVAIIGVGYKLGLSIGRKFAREGYIVAILSRDLAKLSRLADDIAAYASTQVFAIRIDCSDPRSIEMAFEGVLSLGFVEILVYNAYHPVSWNPTNFIDIQLDEFKKSIAISPVGAFLCAQQVLPRMVGKGRGTILFTGCKASLNGLPGFSDICCAQSSIRALSQCLAQEFQPLGIHVAHVIINGIIGPPNRGAMPSTSNYQDPSSMPISSSSWSSSSVVDQPRYAGWDGPMDPDVLAQTFWHLHAEDRSIWTQEIELRPGGPRPP